MNTTISVKGLSKKIDGKQVLDDLNFDIFEGHVVGLIGPNSSGKSTLLKILMNLWHADAGEIQIFSNKIVPENKENISYLPAMNHLFPWMRIHDAIHYYQDMFEDFDKAQARELCRFLELDERDKISGLSKGICERVLVMLTFSRNARIYMLDDPISGIDLVSREKIMKTIARSQNGENTIIISTRQVEEVETYLDDILFLGNGRLLLSGSVDTIREQRRVSLEDCYREVYGRA